MNLFRLLGKSSPNRSSCAALKRALGSGHWEEQLLIADLNAYSGPVASYINPYFIT